MPSIVPWGPSQDVFLLLDQFGERLGRAWRETDENDTDYETLIRHLLEGQCNNPVQVVAFNTDEGWSLRRLRCGRRAARALRPALSGTRLPSRLSGGPRYRQADPASSANSDLIIRVQHRAPILSVSDHALKSTQQL